MKPDSEYCFWMVLASGPMASTKPIAKKARKIGSVRTLIVWLSSCARPAAGGAPAPPGPAEAMREPRGRVNGAAASGLGGVGQPPAAPLVEAPAALEEEAR